MRYRIGGPNSAAGWAISDSGQMGPAGDSGQPDPFGEGFCGFGDFTICLPYVWQRGNTAALPLPAGNNGVASGFNNWDEVTGKVEKDDLDASCQAVEHSNAGHRVETWQDRAPAAYLPGRPAGKRPRPIWIRKHRSSYSATYSRTRITRIPESGALRYRVDHAKPDVQRRALGK